MSGLGLGRGVALRPLPPPPDIVSDLNLKQSERTDVQSCMDFIDCLLTAPAMVEIPRGERSARAAMASLVKDDSLDGVAVNLPLKQQRETLLC